MKKCFLLIAFLFLTLSKFYGQDTIFSYAWTSLSYQEFDMNDRGVTNKYIYIDTLQSNNIWQLGMPLKPIFNSAYSAPLALVTDTLYNYPNNNTSSFSFIVWTNCNWFKIYFTHRINSDSLSDGGVVEYSIDGGTTWNNIINSGYTLWDFYSSSDSITSNFNKPGFTGTKDWIGAAFEGPTLNNFVTYRFTFTSDGTNTNKEGWMIDDIVINGLMVDIDEIIKNASVQIFPNPTSDFITIKTDNTIQLKSVSIKNVLGSTILTTDQTMIDLSKMETGVYFIELTTDKGRYMKRVIKN